VRRRAARIVLSAFVFGALVLVGCDLLVARAGAGRIAHEPAELPHLPVALVLGTSPTVQGRPNVFYRARIRAAAELWHAGRVRGFLVSGDHGRADYDEPSAMRADLVAAGVPEEYVTRDYAGFRTLDSIVRAREVFGVERVVVVSQEFHVRRALWMAERAGLDAWGYVADDPRQGPRRWRVRAREMLARTAAVADALTGRAPKYLGSRESLTLAPNAP
jgi:SanA protein